MLAGKKIDSIQFYSLLFLSRLFTTITFLEGLRGGIGGTDMVIGSVLSAVLLFISAMPVFLLFRRETGVNILDIISVRSRAFSKIAAALYILLFLYTSVEAGARFGLFAGEVIFPENNIMVFTLMVFALAVYAAYKGLEPLGRTGFILFWAVSAALLLLVLTLISKIDPLNFTPPFYNGPAPVIKSSFYSAAGTFEVCILSLLLPRVSGNAKKGFIWWVTGIGTAVTALMTVFVGVLGEFGNVKSFGFYSLAVLAEFSIFQRLDALQAAVWILLAFIKISFTLYILDYLICYLFSKKRKYAYIIASAAATFIISSYISKNMSLFMLISNALFVEIMYVVMAVVLPIFALLVNCRGGPCAHPANRS
ncbi:MAG: GerAB/ArcD/ProY family transporter [Oscillospiraceae bacterium]|nr:GerAB/ArcD/ProY family transporter [Oscillospiraceae bacterium]